MVPHRQAFLLAYLTQRVLEFSYFFWFPIGFILVAWFGKTAWDAVATSVNDAVENRRLRRHQSVLARHNAYKEKLVTLSRKIILGASFALIAWFVGAAIFMTTEGWSYFDALWFCYQSICTIGYGDFVPDSKRVYLLFYFLLFGLGSVAFLISAVAAVYVAAIEKRVEDRAKRDQVFIVHAVKDFEKATFNILSKFSAEDAEIYDKAWKTLLTEVSVETGDVHEQSPTRLLFEQLMSFSVRPVGLTTASNTSTNGAAATEMAAVTSDNGTMLEKPMDSPAAAARRMSRSGTPFESKSST